MRYFCRAKTCQLTLGQPALHIHYSLIPISSIPIGELLPNGIGKSRSTLYTTTEKSIEREPSEEEKKVFGDWLLSRWRLKDELLEHFYQTGSFSGASGVSSSSATLPVQLSSQADYANLFLGILPGAWIGYELLRATVARLLGSR